MSCNNKGLSSYYDREEGIAWGPVTLEEIKDDFKREQIHKPQRRYTSQGLFNPSKSKTSKKRTKRNKMETNVKVNSESDSIPDISDYLTASENVNNEKSSSDYLSAVENSYALTKSSNNPPESSTYFSSSENENLVGKSTQDMLKCSGMDTTHFNFVKNAMDSSCDYIFNSDHPTFVRSSSSYSVNISENRNNLSDVIEISSDEMDEDGKSSSFSENNVDETSDFLENISEDSIAAESTCHISSAITIPEIDLHQFNDSFDCPLNDTIEKMNILLKLAEEIPDPDGYGKEGDNDTKSSDDVISHTGSLEQQKEHNTDCIRSCNVISGSFLQKPTQCKLPTPVKSPSVKSYIPVKKSPDVFRVPVTPKPKSNQKLSKPQFKNIISPVRMYINYSPSAVLKQNANSATKLSTDLPKKFDPKIIENTASFPSVIYKPSKNQIVASQENMLLPPSIENMMIKSDIIRHERKPFLKNLFDPNESLDSESELTKVSIGDSHLLDTSQDVSFLHKKPAFRK